MFGFNKKEVSIYSPVKGKVVSLETVPDDMFSKRMLGDVTETFYRSELFK